MIGPPRVTAGFSFAPPGAGPLTSKTTTGRKQSAATELRDLLKAEHEQAVPDAVDGTVYADLIQGALDATNWYEIAESLLEGCEGWDKDDD